MRPNGITRAIARTALQAKKQSPHIFFGVGLAGVVSGGVLACRATLKLEPELDKLKEDLDTVKTARTDLAEGGNLVDHTDADGNPVDDAHYQRLTVACYATAAGRLTRLYGPAILITGVGIACLTGSHIQLSRRNAALQATLVAVQAAYDEYRERMREELGEKKENEIYRNLQGLNKDEAPEGRNPNLYSPYARIFDEANPNWRKDAELNKMHIRCQENYANHLLTSRGHVFLNEVYDVLGFEHTREGSIVGWISNSAHDNYIDFGIWDVRNANFINGTERNVWLDFNVDGIIFDKI